MGFLWGLLCLAALHSLPRVSCYSSKEQGKCGGSLSQTMGQIPPREALEGREVEDTAGGFTSKVSDLLPS